MFFLPSMYFPSTAKREASWSDARTPSYPASSFFFFWAIWSISSIVILQFFERHFYFPGQRTTLRHLPLQQQGLRLKRTLFSVTLGVFG
jgi:hypothetical protein